MVSSDDKVCMTTWSDGHGLLCWSSGPFNMPYSVKPWCAGTFGGHVKLNTHQMMGLTTE